MAQGPMSFQFWWRSGSPPGSRSLKSEIRIHWTIKLPIDLDEILWRAGVWAGNQLITFWWPWASLSGSGRPFRIPEAGSGKNCHIVNTHRTDALQKSFSNSIMLAFGGGLCSLSTSSSRLVADFSSGSSKSGIRPFSEIWSSPALAKFLARFGRCLCSCTAVSSVTYR